MARYIEAVKTAKIISEKLNIPLGDLVDIFAEIPTADVVKVVKCKDCAYYKPYSKPVEDFDGKCIARECETDENEFCSYGERRDT